MDTTIRFEKRDGKNKGEAKRLRRSGKIPCVVYSKKHEAENVSIEKSAFEAILRSLKQGFLPTTIFTLEDDSGKKKKAIVKDVQYTPTSYDFVHLDFQELEDDRPVRIKVPVQCVNTVDCVGVKAGGQVRTVMRHMRIECLPKDIPTHFDIDVKDLGMNQVKQVKDMQIPATIRSLVRQDDTVVMVAKR